MKAGVKVKTILVLSGLAINLNQTSAQEADMTRERDATTTPRAIPLAGTEGLADKRNHNSK